MTTEELRELSRLLDKYNMEYENSCSWSIDRLSRDAIAKAHKTAGSTLREMFA